jgi:8-oxo-dGTP pyrophosphatase MutT (NUDIX family)
MTGSDETTNKESLIASIRSYHTAFADERFFIPRFLDLLKHQRAFFRDHLPGHITGSAWISDISSTKVLLTHHAKLNRWLQPGGHADGDENVVRVARREAIEETGLKSIKLLTENIFDIDIHTIPVRPDFPAHDHYDVRFLFTADASEKFTVTEESHDLAWVPLSEIASRTSNNLSMLRMAEKTGRRR